MTLNVKMNQLPRLSLWFWIRHPIQAYWIMFLVREAFRQNQIERDPNSLTNGERTAGNRAIEMSRKQAKQALRKINLLHKRQQAALDAAKRERRLATELHDRLCTPPTRTNSIVIPPLPLAEARSLLAEQRAKVKADIERGGTRHLDSPSKVRRATAYGLLGVDIIALFSVFSTVFNVDLSAPELKDLAITGGFSAIAALVLGQLAHSTGHQVWQSRVTTNELDTPQRDDPGQDEGEQGEQQQALTATNGEFPAPRLMLKAKMVSLGVVSVLSGFSILTRVVEEAEKIHQPLLGWVLGLLVAAAAIVAPWLVVIDEMRSGSVETRTIDALTKMVQDLDSQSSTYTDNAAKSEAEAANCQREAEGIRDEVALEDTPAANGAQKVIYMARSMHGAAGHIAAEPDESAGRTELGDFFRPPSNVLNDALSRMKPAT
ncbi:hypothetical protein [Amycolatopsis thailandensis]|uniref:Uncharacterized protein n=2 Tax=Amycolatopsis thailandensis TaxID=589330 RepID=A0A229SI42_9PSEU|nr:hypothetical protein [Amycolatopsis thailandensis]OXM58536.1 hypothetical protein CFP71_02360 [Amycolatopsis thailandensis]